ncbi:hypothetical protein FQK07_14890 [Synechococcus sp. BSF8S]|uniref:hypothetical protein n=1 Tax=Synechococcales TaxID=1890424 RepID=UPI0016244EC4|nr:MULTISPECIES: hypothetical protein [unclassified Synechococcus]MBC1262510.1 hypothetical protein [Synechococcus sp. BSF8S]MBC1263667.1 hypothetical protein [Synechococcus sp. BSA11S]
MKLLPLAAAALLVAAPAQASDACLLKFLPGNPDGVSAGRVEQAGIRFVENGVTYFGVRGGRFNAASVEVLTAACDTLTDEGTP